MTSWRAVENRPSYVCIIIVLSQPHFNTVIFRKQKTILNEKPRHFKEKYL